MVTEKRISRMKRTFVIDNVKDMFVLSILQTVKHPYQKLLHFVMFLYNWKTIFGIKRVNFKLPKHGNKGNNWE